MLEDPEHAKKCHAKAKMRLGYAERIAQQEKRRWAKIKANPHAKEKQLERSRQWYAENKERVRAKRRATLEAMSPEERAWFRQLQREYARQWYAENREAVQARRQERLNAMSPDELDTWLDKTRAYHAEYKRRWRAEIKANPEKHQAYLDKEAEYRRRRRLAELLTTMGKLEEKK